MTAAKGVNLTAGREKVLRAVMASPGLFAGAIAELFPRLRSDGTNMGWSRQGATRWGCGYASFLVRVDMLKIDTHVDCGGARYFITAAGIQALDEIDEAKAQLPPRCGP